MPASMRSTLGPAKTLPFGLQPDAVRLPAQGHVLLKQARLAVGRREPQRMLLGATADAAVPKLDQARQLLGARDGVQRPEAASKR